MGEIGLIVHIALYHGCGGGNTQLIANHQLARINNQEGASVVLKGSLAKLEAVFIILVVAFELVRNSDEQFCHQNL